METKSFSKLLNISVFSILILGAFALYFNPARGEKPFELFQTANAQGTTGSGTSTSSCAGVNDVAFQTGTRTCCSGLTSTVVAGGGGYTASKCILIPTTAPANTGTQCQMSVTVPALAMCSGITGSKNGNSNSFNEVMRGDQLVFNCVSSSSLTSSVVKNYRLCKDVGGVCSVALETVSTTGTWTFNMPGYSAGNYRVECQLCLQSSPSICSGWGKTNQIMP